MKEYKEFPKGLFPPLIEDFIQDSARAQGLCPDFIYCAFISAISVMIGNKCAVKIIKKWVERPLVWIALVGNSGVKKTPAIDLIFSPLEEIEERNNIEYTQSMREYQESIKAGEKGVEKPLSKQLILDDTTIEGLYDVLQYNNSGLILKKDELLSLIYEGGRYSSTNGQEERLLSIFSGASIKINRKGDSLCTFIKKPFVSLIGGIQPRVTKVLFAENRADNGFINRILFASLDNLERKMPCYDPNDELASEYDNYIKRAYIQSKQFDSGGKEVSYIPLSKEAMAIFKTWQEDFIYGNKVDKSYEDYIAKQEAYAVRLSLIIEYSWEVLNEGKPVAVSRKSMESAIEFCSYFFQSFVRVRNMQQSPEELKVKKEVELKNIALKEFQEGKSKKEVVLNLLKRGYSNGEIHKATLIPKATISLYRKGG